MEKENNLPLALAPSLEEVDRARRVFDAFKGTSLKHRSRDPLKAAWLREQGIDPDKAFASA